ncbi:MAG: response regulator [Anaerolineae bacterium]|nr:response regulator [Anaerolineae bacterium]
MPSAQILVVEDKTIIAKDIQQTLRGLGYDALATAPSGEEAIQKATELKPDLVLMDIRLKGELDGITAAAQIQTHFDIPVVYLTAHADEETIQRAKLTGPFGYILKPFAEKELHIAIEMALHMHNLERKLKNQERWLAATLESIGDAVLTTDADGKIIYLNPVAQALTGWTLAEASGKDVTEFLNIVDETTGAPAMNPLAKALQTNEAAHFDGPTLLVAKDNSTRLVEDIATPIRDESNEIMGGVLVFRDVSQSRQLEEQLRQVQKMETVGQLAAGVAHNFNNMLTTILGNVNLVRATLPADQTAHQDLQTVEETAQRAASLVRQLLTFARHQVIHPRPFNLNDLILSLDTTLHQLFPETVELNLITAPELGLIKIDSGQIEQLLFNLVLNARDALPNGGKVVIETANITLNQPLVSWPTKIFPGDYIVLIVTDTGIGISQEILPHIFEPFFTTKQVGQGTGLGLSSCLGIVQQNQGGLSVKSKPGQGSTFKAFFPRFQPPAVELQPEPQIV